MWLVRAWSVRSQSSGEGVFWLSFAVHHWFPMPWSRALLHPLSAADDALWNRAHKQHKMAAVSGGIWDKNACVRTLESTPWLAVCDSGRRRAGGEEYWASINAHLHILREDICGMGSSVWHSRIQCLQHSPQGDNPHGALHLLAISAAQVDRATLSVRFNIEACVHTPPSHSQQPMCSFQKCAPAHFLGVSNMCTAKKCVGAHSSGLGLGDTPIVRPWEGCVLYGSPRGLQILPPGAISPWGR